CPVLLVSQDDRTDALRVARQALLLVSVRGVPSDIRDTALTGAVRHAATCLHLQRAHGLGYRQPDLHRRGVHPGHRRTLDRRQRRAKPQTRGRRRTRSVEGQHARVADDLATPGARLRRDPQGPLSRTDAGDPRTDRGPVAGSRPSASGGEARTERRSDRCAQRQEGRMSIAAGAPGWGAWSADPAVIGAVLLSAAGYAGCYRRLARRTGRRYTGHVLAFGGGLCVVMVALLSPVDELADRWLLSAHMLQHVLLADIAPALLVLGIRPPLLALGLPPALLRVLSPRARFGRLLRNRLMAPIALGLWAATQWGWSIPTAFDFAAAHPLVHAIEHLSLLGSGLLLWTVVVDPLPGSSRRALWSRLGYLGASRAISRSEEHT